MAHSLVVVSGKGGVGKSAVTAALALRAQREGRKVLVMAMAGGEGLAAHLSLTRLDYQPFEVRPGLFATAIDRSKALTEYLHVQLGVPAVAAFGPLARAFDVLASAAPAVREVVTMGKVLWEVRRGAWDSVIVDAPPTGQIGSYLRAAGTIAELVPAGRVRDQATWMEQIIADRDHTRLVVVTLAEELPMNETMETLAWMRQERLFPEILVNRILPPLPLPAGAKIPTGPAGEAALLHRALADEQEVWLKLTPTAVRLPYLFGLVTPAEVAAQLSEVAL